MTVILIIVLKFVSTDKIGRFDDVIILKIRKT